MKKTIIISIILLSSIGISKAQTSWALSYEPATPIGDMTNFIGQTTLRGLNGSANWFITNKISAGVSFQWTGFYEKNERETWTYDGGAVTATAWKEFYLWSLYANGKYQFKDVEEEGNFVPYIGLNIGTMYIDQNIQVGTYTEQSKSWKFALAPEVGARTPHAVKPTTITANKSVWNFIRRGYAGNQPPWRHSQTGKRYCRHTGLPTP